MTNRIYNVLHRHHAPVPLIVSARTIVVRASTLVPVDRALAPVVRRVKLRTMYGNLDA